MLTLSLKIATTLPSSRFDCIVILSNTHFNTKLLQDSLGWFFNCAQQLVTKSEEIYSNDDDDEDTREEDFSSRDKMSELLEELAKRYSDADFVDLGFEKEADFARGSAEGDRNAYRAELVRSLLESLMDYTIMHGADVDETKARRLVGLYRRHEEVSSLLKVNQNFL